MLRLILRSIGICALLAVPLAAFADFNTVTLTTDTVISVGGYTLNVSGSSAVIQSIVVDAGDFSVTLASGSSLTVSSPTLNELSSSAAPDITGNNCSGSASSLSLAYSGAGTVTNVITPSATICGASSSSSSGGSGSSGGGGGVVGSYGAVSSGYSGVASSPPASSGTPAASSGQASGNVYDFTGTLQIGSTGEDVTQLQNILIAGGYLNAAATGYFGPLTKAAVEKYQAANGIEAVGIVGPKTRSLLNGGEAATGAASTASAYTFTQALQVGSHGSEVTALQNVLIRLNLLQSAATGYFGPLTEAAVKAYQAQWGIPQTGTVGPLTRAQLNK